MQETRVVRSAEDDTSRWRWPAFVVRDHEAGSNLQVLLVSAVTTVLVTRLYLSMTGYPRIGGGPLHIAHLLWGGLLMLIGLIVLLSALGNRAKRVAAIVGGLGFGLFLDELGKFVTADNDYFFQPTIALIYIVFIALFLLFRAIERRSLSPEESLVNAADILVDVILGGATRAELARMRWLLRRSGEHSPMVEALEQAMASATRAREQRSPLNGVAISAWRTYDHLLRWRWFQRVLWMVFVGQAVLGLVTTVAVGLAAMSGAERLPATVVSSTLSLGLTVVGVVRLPNSRLAAYRWFERGVLISVFFTQVIMFWQDQLTALGGLLWDLVLLAVLRFLIRQEGARIVTER
jgi:hypothetical protein